MDNNLSLIKKKKIVKTIENLKKNNMEAYYAQNEEELLAIIKELISEGQIVAFGGSVSLAETGILDFLRNGNFNLLDRNKEGLSSDEVEKIFRDAFSADTYLASSNAITEDGELFNVDGRGNRVAAMLYGPKSVIIVAGVNKIVKNANEAVQRNREISAPANAMRLKLKCPCVETGYCMDCNSQDKICNDYVLIRRQNIKGRIKVIIVDKKLGY